MIKDFFDIYDKSSPGSLFSKYIIKLFIKDFIIVAFMLTLLTILNFSNLLFVLVIILSIIIIILINICSIMGRYQLLSLINFLHFPKVFKKLFDNIKSNDRKYVTKILKQFKWYNNSKSYKILIENCKEREYVKTYSKISFGDFLSILISNFISIFSLMLTNDNIEIKIQIITELLFLLLVIVILAIIIKSILETIDYLYRELTYKNKYYKHLRNILEELYIECIDSVGK